MKRKPWDRRSVLKGSALAAGLCAALATAAPAQGQTPQAIRLWPGKAPGSENWSIPEATTTSPSGDRTITNVSDPTLTVFLPEAAAATGAAVRSPACPRRVRLPRQKWRFATPTPIPRPPTRR